MYLCDLCRLGLSHIFTFMSLFHCRQISSFAIAQISAKTWQQQQQWEVVWGFAPLAHYLQELICFFLLLWRFARVMFFFWQQEDEERKSSVWSFCVLAFKSFCLCNILCFSVFLSCFQLYTVCLLLLLFVCCCVPFYDAFIGWKQMSPRSATKEQNNLL